jgi:TonB family protein
MNSCPLCHRTYDDETMKFCLEDGTALQPATVVTDPDATLVLPKESHGERQPTVGNPQTPTFTERPMRTQVDPVFAAPGFQAAERSRKSVLPWILGIVIVLGLSAIGVAFFLTRYLIAESRRADQLTAVTSVSPAPAENESPSPQSLSAVPDTSPRPQASKGVAETIPTVRPTNDTTPYAAPPGETKPAPRAPISGGVLNGKAVRLVQPPYPPIARAAHASGAVVVQVLIDENGNVVSAHAVSGHPLLQAVSVAAARSSKFSPTKLSGQPVKVTGVIQYNFVAQ